MQELKIAVFDGDGIGPEITAPTVALLDRVARDAQCRLDFETYPCGAGHYRDHGVALPPSSIAGARASDAILLSAMGLPDVRYPDGTEIVPQVDLRIELGLYAGVRPVKLLPGQKSPLTVPEGKTLDFILIRESIEGLFARMNEGVVTETEARETLVITREVTEKLFDFAFRLARQRKEKGYKGRVTCVDKANVFRAFAFMRKIFHERAALNPDIIADAAYVDAMALWMVQKPWDFDVLVTENMFGDILSDLGAGLMGGLGMAPSADIGDGQAVFQPCHGTAPDITGKGIANPLAMILSGAMMLEWLAGEKDMPGLSEASTRLNNAVSRVLTEGVAVTPDLGGSASTTDLAAAVEAAL
ncbi:isocitrate/isopropylmalate dehydrogenase family protein [Rhodobacteraceae bacterium NNCM2]|nr:isocitrate/isopropylmalate dehydrogenase family protein [Coraliihabitans acroporae]